MAVTLNGTNGLTFNDGSSQATAATGFGFKNRLINSAMVIDQRNAGASVTITTAQIYPVDRFFGQGSITSKFTAQQSSTAPTGFVNSLLFTSSAATTPSASDYYYFNQPIEGYNIADLGWGTASAATVTLSFWVRSSLTGTFSGALLNGASNRSYAFTYTISSANTWEQKSVTIAGDTSGTWLTTNGIGINVRFALGAGSSYLQSASSWGTGNVVGATGTTQWISTNGATFYITGVQLEKGSTATNFDYRPFGMEFMLCQRYYRTSFPYGTAPVQNGGQQGALAMQAQVATANTVNITIQVSPPMRTNPGTITYYNPSAANANWRNTSTNTDGGATGQINGSSTGWMVFMNSTPAGANTYQIHYSADAEM